MACKQRRQYARDSDLIAEKDVNDQQITGKKKEIVRMDNVLLKSFKERFGTNAQEKWLHVPNSIVVGRSKNGSKLAAISARWLKDSWPGKSTFEKWCGFAPSNSRQGTIEVLKAASGLVDEVENVPTSGFKLSLSLNCDELLEGRGAARPTRQPLLMPNCALSTCGMSYAYIDTYNKPVIAVEDPRGWAIMVSQAQVVKLMAARACSSADRLELPGPLVYVFNKCGFTIDFPDGELARAAVDDNAVDEVKKSVVSQKKNAVLEVGQIYTDVSKRTEMVYLGMFPQDLTSSQMDTVCTFVQPALKAIYDAAVFSLVEVDSRHELDGADNIEQKEKAVTESLQKKLQSVSAKHTDEIGELDCALKVWRILHDTLAATFACIGKHRSDGRLFTFSIDLTDVEKHSIESLLVARPYDVDVIKHGIRVEKKNMGWWTKDDRPNSKEISGFLKPPKGVF